MGEIENLHVGFVGGPTIFIGFLQVDLGSSYIIFGSKPQFDWCDRSHMLVLASATIRQPFDLAQAKST